MSVVGGGGSDSLICAQAGVARHHGGHTPCLTSLGRKRGPTYHTPSVVHPSSWRLALHVSVATLLHQLLLLAFYMPVVVVVPQTPHSFSQHGGAPVSATLVCEPRQPTSAYIWRHPGPRPTRPHQPLWVWCLTAPATVVMGQPRTGYTPAALKFSSSRALPTYALPLPRISFWPALSMVSAPSPAPFPTPHRTPPNQSDKTGIQGQEEVAGERAAPGRGPSATIQTPHCWCAPPHQPTNIPSLSSSSPNPKLPACVATPGPPRRERA